MKVRKAVRALVNPWRAYREKIDAIHELLDKFNKTQYRLDRVSEERDELKRQLDNSAAFQFYEPGHFYSPVPSKRDVREYLAKLERQPSHQLPAIDLNDQVQLALLDALRPYYPRIPFQAQPAEGLLYHFNNPNYPHADGIILFCMLNHLRPRRLIEIGSGYSTCAILDTNRLFLDSQMQITSIEPHPELLRSLLAKTHDALTIIESKLQDTQIEIFDQLEPGDILFIDSSHISKVGSDVNYIIFDVLPRLKRGVIIQIHDIYFGFEYPGVWLREGRAWNEAYLLRAFLEYNEHFRILLFISYLQNMYEPWFRDHMPDTLVNKGGCFWMEKV
jgi:predicted O-methyltransferase YrrM